MGLAAGTRLGPYEIIADGEPQSRQEREARAISTLNHPNLCALCDIGSAGGIGFLLMESLEGEPLAVGRRTEKASPSTDSLPQGGDLRPMTLPD